MFHYVAIVCVLGVVSAAPSGLALGPLAVGVDSVSVPRYNFNYAVSDPLTGDNKAQSEIREGGVVKGSYSLAEPDGTIRVVEYAADPVSGFNAVVKRVGPATHPQPIIAKSILAAPIAPVTSVINPIAAPILTTNLGLGLNRIDLGGVGGLGLGYGGLGLGGLGLAGDLGLWSWKH